MVCHFPVWGLLDLDCRPGQVNCLLCRWHSTKPCQLPPNQVLQLCITHWYLLKATTALNWRHWHYEVLRCSNVSGIMCNAEMYQLSIAFTEIYLSWIVKCVKYLRRFTLYYSQNITDFSLALSEKFYNHLAGTRCFRFRPKSVCFVKIYCSVTHNY